MTAAENPLLPAGYDIIWSSVMVAAIAVLVLALVSIGRAKDVTGWRALGWIVVVLCLPVAGAVLWFLVGRTPRVTTS